MTSEVPPRQSSNRNRSWSSGDRRDSFFWTLSSTLMVARFVSRTTSSWRMLQTAFRGQQLQLSTMWYMCLSTGYHPLNKQGHKVHFEKNKESVFYSLKSGNRVLRKDYWLKREIHKKCKYLKSFILTAMQLLLIRSLLRANKGRIFWPGGERHPGVIQYLCTYKDALVNPHDNILFYGNTLKRNIYAYLHLDFFAMDSKTFELS